MSLPDRIGAFSDCIDYFEKALASSRGIRVEFADWGDATHFVMRMNQARKLERQDARRMFTHDDPRWGKSAFDCLMVRRPKAGHEDNWWVYIDRAESAVASVEELE